LCTALDLENTHGIGRADFFVSGFFVGRNIVKRVRTVGALSAELYGILQHGHHAKAEKIDFHDAEVFAVIFVPLANTAVGHSGKLEWDNPVELPLANDHAARMLAEVTR